ncbi:MAG: SCO family protein [Candidatus Kariarchaeaceae archaeon]|jgi:protein SCO1/2
MQEKAIGLGLLSIIIIAGVSYTMWTALQDNERDFNFQDYGPAPNFTLTSIDGESVTFDDHTQKVRVLTFIYTRCIAGCGTITLRMMNVLFSLNQQSIQDDVEFFIINFDYMHDNASVLQKYANTYAGDNTIPTNIKFLLGAEPEINQTATDWGFYYELYQSPMMHDMNDTMDMEMNDTMTTDMEMNDTVHEGHEVVWIHPFVVYVIDKQGEIKNKLWGLEWEQKYLEDMVKALR